MDDTGGPRDEDLAETTRQQNSNLRLLIDAVGTLLAGSRELLQRMQPLGKGEPPDDTARGQGHADDPTIPLRTSRHPPNERKAKGRNRIAITAFDCRHLHPAPPPGSAPKAKGGNPGVALQNLPIVQRGALFQSAPETPHGPRLPSA